MGLETKYYSDASNSLHFAEFLHTLSNSILTISLNLECPFNNRLREQLEHRISLLLFQVGQAIFIF